MFLKTEVVGRPGTMHLSSYFVAEFDCYTDTIYTSVPRKDMYSFAHLCGINHTKKKKDSEHTQMELRTWSMHAVCSRTLEVQHVALLVHYFHQD